MDSQDYNKNNPMKGVNIGKSLVQRMNKQVQEWKKKSENDKVLKQAEVRTLKNGQKNKLSLPSRKSQEEACQASIMTVNWRKVNAGDRSAKLKKSRDGDMKKRQDRVLFKSTSVVSFLPKKSTKYAAGYDVSTSQHRITILKGHQMTEVPLGWSVLMPTNCYGTLALRSGFHRRHPHLAVIGGIIDADYSGEVRMMLMNHGDEDVKVYRGHEFAQIVIAQIPQVPVYERNFDNDEQEATVQKTPFQVRADWKESKDASEAMEYQFDTQQQRADIYGMETELHEVSAEEMMSDQELLSAVEEYEFQDASPSIITRAPPQKWCNCDVGQQDVVRLSKNRRVCGNCDYDIEPSEFAKVADWQMECTCKEPIHVIDEDTQLLIVECGRCNYIIPDC
jgi:dUTP pyrophosphatase